VLCEVLLEQGANKAAEAAIISSNGSDVRMLQAIHLAAGAGNKRTIELLLEKGANPNAAATLNGELHYMPIHDAAWFNRQDCARVLIEQGASIDAQNNNGMTGLHLASMHGYPGLVKLFLDRHECPEKLLLLENMKGEIPLDMALRRGYFPLEELSLFTQDLGHDGRIRAFNAAADSCPSAAFWILRSKDSSSEERNFKINAEWRQSLQKAAQQKQITVPTLTKLMEQAPDAALCLLDALTETPEIRDQQHNPLPVRAALPKSICGADLSVEYEHATSWEWTQEENTNELGMNAWQQRLAPPNSREGTRVAVRVLLLSGIISLEAIYGLTRASDPRIFSKPAVQAILKFAWHRLRWMFGLDLLHEVLCICVLTMWASGVSRETEPVNLLTKHLMWSVLASHGATQLLNFGFDLWKLYHLFGLSKEVLNFLSRKSFRAVFGLSSIYLVCQMLPSFRLEDKSNAMLSLNCLLHCFNLLMQLKAFEPTGFKLLPIIKSVMPIAQMLGLMVVLLLGFVLSFWSVDPTSIGEGKAFEVGFMAFTGEPVGNMDNPQSQLLAMFLILVFLTCTMNVFIAVLGDSYDVQQEKMLCTFMKERAKLCSKLLMSTSRPVAAFILFLGLLSEAAGLVPGEGEVCHAIFVGLSLALVPAGAIQCARAELRRRTMSKWSERHLWFCHDANVEESFSMYACGADLDDNHSGRLQRIKRSVFEVRKCVTDQHRTAKAQQSSMLSLQREVAAVAQTFRAATAPGGACNAGLAAQVQEMQRQTTAMEFRQEKFEASVQEMNAGIQAIIGMLGDAQQGKSLLRAMPAHPSEKFPPV
jgi:hypothetical protein